MRIARAATAVLIALSISSTSALAQKPTYKWGPAPPVFPAGAKMAVVSGDPTKAAPFTVRLDFPANYKIAPHSHPTDETITVISGTFMVGMGEKVDKSKMETLHAGGKHSLPANARHYAQTKGHTVVEVQGMGPFAINYVNPADDPSKKKK